MMTRAMLSALAIGGCAAALAACGSVHPDPDQSYMTYGSGTSQYDVGQPPPPGFVGDDKTARGHKEPTPARIR
jgi:hypothetical protein